MARKSSKEGPAKSTLIREYMTANPSASPKEVAAAVTAQGVECTSEYVSTIKAMDKAKQKAGKPKGKPGRPPGSGKKAAAAAEASAAPVAEAAPTGALSLDTLLAAKKLATALGGVANAKAVLDVLSKLGV